MALIHGEVKFGDYGLLITDESNNSMKIDIPVEQGGLGEGMRPMQSLLAALGGCSTVDIISILKKQKQDISYFAFSIDGEREKDKVLSLWEWVTIRFHFKGDIEVGKAIRAADLSINKYCSVAETLRRSGTTINLEVEVNGVLISKNNIPE
ncbi:OsmC family protein [Flavobacterium sp. '19STA2R22 D10 B1']|uniref:OsmC family protein n=1 Tax=Flavobacterium aerium TaxID=3037261 RepID=UPI00278C55C1|nr:OsmC family protein [Flavobacterium sp. '19STA2R22 D10 B1']